MIRLHFVVEGKTEKFFVDGLLAPHLATFEVYPDSRLVLTSRSKARTSRGGMTSYARAKMDLSIWMKQDQGPDAFFTSMFDLYALPDDFPGFEDARRKTDPYARVLALEEAFRADLSHRRFVPYIQLHEFEALVLADPMQLAARYPEHEEGAKGLATTCSAFASPELIDDGLSTAPSKRIEAAVPAYDKVTAGPAVAARIGIGVLRARCPHFGAWLDSLEHLATDAAASTP